MGVLDGRVCLITGAANGIGREHALHLASEGAHVVVNDLGGATDGTGADTSAAQVVADEIVAAGGKAVANTESVTDFDGAERMVAAAVDIFGDLHVVINNAGILRDRMLASMGEDEFDAVVGVHMKGTFNVSRHAAAYWRAQDKLGSQASRSIVNTTSGAGLHGNPGQTNYAAAKAGIAAMTIVNGMELKRYGVSVNCIAPLARTRLTLQTPGVDKLMADPVFDPENTSPLVAALSAADCPFNGQIFSVVGGSVGLYAGWSIAEEVESDERWTAQGLIDAMQSLPSKVKVNTQMHKMAELAKGSQ